jgi:drug/metabolite transporter (DMT)-like permease
MTRGSAIAAAIFSAMCFGSLAVLVVLAYDGGAEPLQLLVWRFSIAAVLLAAYVAVTSRRELLVSRADLGRLSLLSVAGYGAASLCFAFALWFTDASIAAILLYTYPAMVVLAERVLGGEPLTPSRIGAVLMTFVGCVLVIQPFGAGAAVDARGVVLGLGAAAGYANFSVSSQRLLKRMSRSTVLTYMLGFTALMGLIAALASGATLVPTGWDTSVWLVLAAIVIFPTFLAIIFYFSALRSLGAPQAALISTFEPVFTLALAALVLSESLGSVQLLGAAFVFGGVLVAEWGARRAQQIAAV